MHRSQILIAGGGFAGVGAALAAAAGLERHRPAHETRITLISPDDALG
jgi:NADH dehydrogenase FAD-containing subunit